MAFVRAGIDNLPAPHTVEVLIHTPAATARQHLGRWATVEDTNDGRCLLRMTSDSLDWPAMALGAEFTVLCPPELLEYLRDWADRFSRATTPSARD